MGFTSDGIITMDQKIGFAAGRLNLTDNISIYIKIYIQMKNPFISSSSSIQQGARAINGSRPSLKKCLDNKKRIDIAIGFPNQKIRLFLKIYRRVYTNPTVLEKPVKFMFI